MTPVSIRHFYVTDADGNHPWFEPSGHSRATNDWTATRTPEEVVAIFHGDAAGFWERFGIALLLDRIEPLQADEFYDMSGGTSDERVHKALIAREWQPGQPFYNVYWVRKGRAWWGSAFSPTNYVEDVNTLREITRLSFEPSFGICLETGKGIPDNLFHRTNGNPEDAGGAVLAHELGHAFGLAHSFLPEEFLKRFLFPFSNDIPPLDSFEEDRNIMSYWFNRHVEKTVPSTGLRLSEQGMTSSQEKRALATLFRRTSPFVDYLLFANLIPFVAGGSLLTPEEWRAQPELTLGEFAVYPDFVATLNAAWMG